MPEAQNPTHITHPLPFHTVYVYVYSTLIHTGKGGGRVEPERRTKEKQGRAQSTKMS
jgi:hypothetical protein